MWQELSISEHACLPPERLEQLLVTGKRQQRKAGTGGNMGCEGAWSLVTLPDPPGDKGGGEPIARRVRDQGATQAFQKAFAAASPASVPH